VKGFRVLNDAFGKIFDELVCTIKILATIDKKTTN